MTECSGRLQPETLPSNGTVMSRISCSPLTQNNPDSSPQGSQPPAPRYQLPTSEICRHFSCGNAPWTPTAATATSVTCANQVGTQHGTVPDSPPNYAALTRQNSKKLSLRVCMKKSYFTDFLRSTVIVNALLQFKSAQLNYYEY